MPPVATVSYDGDGLSEEIAKLIAPPGNCKKLILELGGRVIEPDIPVKRPAGVKPNNDYCGFCGEGGGLICCERCPAAYHYHCCEPPLDPNNIPSDDWLCNDCIPPPPEPPENQANIFLKQGMLDIGRTPVPFSLPDELQPSSELPGSTESRKRKNYNPGHDFKRRYNPAYPEDMTIFTRTPVCYKCDKSDKGGRPLIFCSYCPLAYHLDCLYPPLPFRPTGLWMCPAHPQYLVPDFHSLRMSVRLQAHEREQEAVDHHGVKTAFIQKVAKCRRSVQNEGDSNRRVAQVPPAVQQYYRIGVACCRANLKVKSPPSLKELSAQSLAAKLARNDSKCIAGVCVNKTCKHAAQQCKHFPATNGAAALKQGDNGVKKYPVNLTPQTVDSSLKGLDEATIRQLASQFLQQQQQPLLNGDSSHPSIPHPVKPSLKSIKPNIAKTNSNTDMKSCLPLSQLAAHSFLQKGDEKFSIRKNSFIIGIGQRADLRLDTSQCKAVSLLHSCILFDKVTGIHELLNYSEFGTIVNNLYYGCSDVPHTLSRCVCSPSIPMPGWEGPCQLPDGAIIKVGCHSFTFRTNPVFIWSPEISPEDCAAPAEDSLDYL